MMLKKIELTPLQRFWRLLKPDASEIRNVYIYAIFNGLINLSLPLGIQAIINLIQGGELNFSWFMLILFVVGGIALAGIMQISQLRITENLQQKIFTRAAFEFAYRIPRIRLDVLYKEYAPELMNRFFDVVSVQKGLSKIVIGFSTAAIQIVFGLILLSFYHPFFIAFSLILVVLIYLLFKYTAEKGLHTSIQESKHKYKIAHKLEEIARTNMTFKLAGETDLPLEMIEEGSKGYIDARESHFSILRLQYMLMIGFKLVVALGLLLIGSLLVMNQQMNIGQFVAAEIIIILVLNSVEKIILGLETIYDVLTSLEKIGQITDLELEDEKGIGFTNDRSKGALAVELIDVSFSYPGHQRKVLDGISFKINPGERVLVTGDSDSGKSTLLYLLSALYRPSSGAVLIDGLPIRNYNPRSLRTHIGDCLMDEQLFEGSILENISLGRPGIGIDSVRWAIEKVGLLDLIQRLPEGLNTMVMPEGQQFSKGAVDKFLLARSIVDKPGLLLIKDNFSLFSEDERETLLQFLIDKDNPWTLIIASSNRSLSEHVDRVIELKEGNLTRL